MDRLEAHTRHCRSCSGALRRLTHVQQLCELLVVAGLAGLAWCGGSGAGGTALVALLLTAAALACRWRCQAWIQQLKRGSGQPPRNRLSGRGRGRARPGR